MNKHIIVGLAGVVVGAGLVLGIQGLADHIAAENYRIEASLEACRAEVEKFTWGWCEVDYNGQVQIHHNGIKKIHEVTYKY